jgi:hypothetical protein
MRDVCVIHCQRVIEGADGIAQSGAGDHSGSGARSILIQEMMRFHGLFLSGVSRAGLQCLFGGNSKPAIAGRRANDLHHRPAIGL